MNSRIWLVCLATTIVLAGCGDGKSKPKSVDVKGTVNLDGKPMPDGDVSFLVSGESPTIFPVSNGAFSGKAYSGKNKVEIRSYKKAAPSPTALSTDTDTKLNYLPEKYNTKSTFEADVAVGGANDFKYEVTSK